MLSATMQPSVHARRASSGIKSGPDVISATQPTHTISAYEKVQQWAQDLELRQEVP